MNLVCSLLQKPQFKDKIFELQTGNFYDGKEEEIAVKIATEIVEKDSEHLTALLNDPRLLDDAIKRVKMSLEKHLENCENRIGAGKDEINGEIY